MPDRPLVLFAQPSAAEKAKRGGGPSHVHFPTPQRQVERLTPRFQALQHALDQGGILFTQSPNAIDPEYTLVFEAVGDPSRFYDAVNKLKTEYPNIEWIVELSNSCPSDEDFYMSTATREAQNGSQQLSTKIYCILTNLQALQRILSLWDNYKTDPEQKFIRGFAGFRNMFSQLYDIHLWGVKERFEETGVIEAWQDDLNDPDCTNVKMQIELFYRSSQTKRRTAEASVKEHIINCGGTIICTSEIPEIEYHAILAEISREKAEEILSKQETELITADEIMFIKSSAQTVSVGTSDSIIDTASPAMPDSIIQEPIVALFDGCLQENHPLLSDLLMVDDFDEIGARSTVDTRTHGTAMASLILRGQEMNSVNSSVHKLYVRPIMQSEKAFNDRISTFIPEDVLIVDKIHECVRRLFETSDGRVAPSVKIVNLSIGIQYREYYNLISPLARLLDWLSYKYRILFIVSAGNHPDPISLENDYSAFACMSDEEKNQEIIKYISNNLRNLRLLSPAESMNSLTIGAVFSDTTEDNVRSGLTLLSANGFPAAYSSFGRGINHSIKPDILYAGGRNLVRGSMTNPKKVQWRETTSQAPGIKAASPTAERNGTNVGFTFGTSNSAALISNKATECYDVLDSVFIAENGEHIPEQYTAVLIKAMLAHGASWCGLDTMFSDVLNLTGQTRKNELHKYLGYGITDVDKVKQCTENQVTLIGYGDIKQDDGVMELLLIKAPKNLAEFNAVVSALATKEPDNPYIIYKQVKRAKFFSDADTEWTLDGEFGGAFKQTLIEVVNKAITILVRKKSIDENV